MTNIQAINLLKGLEQSLDDYCELNDEGKTAFRMAITALEVFGNSEQLPSAWPEQPEYIPDTKAIPSEKDCVDLSESVTATFYDDEHEEWSQKTVTIRDVLDSVCDEYTVLPSAQPEPEIIACGDCKHYICHDRRCGYWNHGVKPLEWCCHGEERNG